MNKTLASLVLGLGILTPMSLDAFAIEPCKVRTGIIEEYPATPINSIDREAYLTNQLGLYQKYLFGAWYVVVDRGYEESVCPSTFPQKDITIVRFAE